MRFSLKLFLGLLSIVSLAAVAGAIALLWQGRTSSAVLLLAVIHLGGMGVLLLITLQGLLIPMDHMQKILQQAKEKKIEIKRIPTSWIAELQDIFHAFRDMVQEVTHSQAEAEEARAILEVRVRARTRELSELASSLEQKIQDRTKELEKQIGELERFRKLVVGRELKMVELKKELEQLQGAKRSKQDNHS